MNTQQSEIQKLISMLQAGTSPATTVQEATRQLSEAGFEELQFQNSWGLNNGGKYFVKHHDTTLFAFTIGEKMNYRQGFRMAAAHTDYPGLRIKPNPDLCREGYGQINVEVYGGPIINTWLDRPLGISGRVAVKSHNLMEPEIRIIDSKEPCMILPNLAIHLNKEVNKGVELNRQTELLPILSSSGGKKETEEKEIFMRYLSKLLKVEKTDILDYELQVTCMQEAQIVGIEKDFLVSPRLDNLTSVQALLTSLIHGTRNKGVNLIALFDHEEIGSRGKQGASSLLLLELLERICECFGRTRNQAKEMIYDSMMLSVDVAQGCHPNYMGKMDLTSHPILNGGFCIKESSSQSYATDCKAVGIIKQICSAGNISYQTYVNRSDLPGGSTLGSIISSTIPVLTVDLGIPVLAMHSAVETMGIKDQIALTNFMKSFFQV